MKKIFLLLLITLLAFTNVNAESYNQQVREINEPIGVNETPDLKTDSNFISVQAYDPSSFVSRWNTSIISTGSSDTDQISLPLAKGTFDFIVEWGDGSSSIITDQFQSQVTHTYASEGVYTLVITGILVGWSFNNYGDRLKIIEISQWGDINFGTFPYSGSNFYGCENLVLTATDAPDLTGTRVLHSTFRDCYKLGSTGSMELWDISLIFDLSNMFSSASSFNLPLNWNVSGVWYMGSMFSGATSFNQPLDGWDVSSVTDMSNMFSGATFFNQPLDGWDVSSLTGTSSMFSGATSFNQQLGSWNVSSVVSMKGMFADASSFNLPIDTWDVSGVFDMSEMFRGTSSFNQSIDSWDVFSVTTMQSMFQSATSFNQPLNNWDVSQVTRMHRMFAGASSFNQPLGSWDVSQVTLMDVMFQSASSFNQPLDSWDVSGATGNGLGAMFQYASSFNQPLGSWDVSGLSGLTSIQNMFSFATSFDQPLGSWDVSSVTSLANLFEGVTLSYQNYDDLLIGWSKLNLQYSMKLDVGDSSYSIAAIAARQNIVQTFGWWILDGGLRPELTSPDDISYKYGTTGNQIAWIASDKYPNGYEVELDGARYTSGSWENGTIIVEIDGLDVGVYEFTIFIAVIRGDRNNIGSDTVVVTVTEATSAASDTSEKQPSATTSSDGSDIAKSPVNPIFIISSMIIIVIYSRKRSDNK